MPRHAAQIQEDLRLADALRSAAHPLTTARDLTTLMERIGKARYVLIGEASHGTSEFYRWRAVLTQRLVEEKGFNVIAVEGDWAECLAANRFVRSEAGTQAVPELTKAFTRWPTWMWANHEVAEFLEWLQSYNGVLPREKKVGFYGLDVYGLWDSLKEVQRMGSQLRDPPLQRYITAVSDCLAEFHGDAQSYGFAAAYGLQGCAEEAQKLLEYVDRRWDAKKSEAAFILAQHAFVIRNAERYYRAMYQSDSRSWNVRDIHMADTLDRLAWQHGPQAKFVIWEHNTHIGNARYTDMAWADEVNIGQLVRERHGRENAVLVGFGTYEGNVIAADAWGNPMRHMFVPPAQPHSWENLLHTAGLGPSYLLSSNLLEIEGTKTPRGHRAIGVVYNPARERDNYIPTALPLRYDAFIYLPITTALHPLHAFTGEEGELPQLYPTGV